MYSFVLFFKAVSKWLLMAFTKMNFSVTHSGGSVAEVEQLIEQHTQLERELTAHMHELERSVKRPTLIESDLRARRRRTSPQASLHLSRRSVRRPGGGGVRFR